MTCGIYLLKFPDTDKVYVGQSLTVEGRFAGHKTKMRRGVCSKKLLEAYTQYGEPSLIIYKACEPQDLNTEENTAISLFNSVDNGFNKLYASGGYGTTHLYGELNGRSIYDNQKIEEVFHLLVDTDMSHTQISDLTTVSVNVVQKVSSGSSHEWLKDIYPEKYTNLLNKKGYRNKGDAVYNSIYSNSLIEEIFLCILDNPSLTQETVASTFEIPRTVVMALCSGSKYKWLKDKHPGKYEELLSRKGNRKAIKDSLRVLPKVRSPNGEIFEVSNISAFAKSNNVDPGALGKVLRGKIPHAKQWTLVKEDNGNS